MRHRRLVLAAALLVAPPLLAQESRVLPEASTTPGTIRLGPDMTVTNQIPRWVTPADRRAAMDVTAQLTTIIRRDPAVSPPMGFILLLSPGLGFGTPPFDQLRHPITAGISGYVAPLYLLDESTGKTREGEGFGWGITANDPHCPFGGSDSGTQVAEDSAGPIYTEPKVVGEEHGFPRFSSGCVAIMKPGARPLWVPVTRERYLGLQRAQNDAQSAEVRKTAAEMKQKLDMLPPDQRAQMRKLLDSLSGVRGGGPDLDAMSPAERRSQAVIDPAGNLLPPGTRADGQMARALVAPNPDFWDRTLPPAAVQMIAVHLWVDPEGRWVTAADQARFKRIRDGLDWDALRAMLR